MDGKKYGQNYWIGKLILRSSDHDLRHAQDKIEISLF